MDMIKPTLSMKEWRQESMKKNHTFQQDILMHLVFVTI